MNNTHPPIFLASQSPRRRELLGLAGWSFTVSPADIDETPFPGEDPREYVIRMAANKAMAVQPVGLVESIIIAADTTVACDGQILGKPANPEEAEEMLHMLRGRVHQVHTGYAVRKSSDEEPLTGACTTQVPMRKYTESEIQDYIASGDPFDKAGGYAIQHINFHPVENLTGCYANVMGLPLCHLTVLLQEIGLEPLTKVNETCQELLSYPCPIYQQVLGLKS